MTFSMLDDIYVSSLPDGADAYLGYVGGTWPTFSSGELQARFPGVPCAGIAISASIDASLLDVENGDATVDQAPGWFARQVARGVPKPGLYISVSSANDLIATMSAAGFPRSSYFLLTSHYAYYPHSCSTECYEPFTGVADGTQWTDVAAGIDGALIDQSVISDEFFTAIGGTPVPPPPIPLGKKKPAMWIFGVTGVGFGVIGPTGKFTFTDSGDALEFANAIADQIPGVTVVAGSGGVPIRTISEPTWDAVPASVLSADPVNIAVNQPPPITVTVADPAPVTLSVDVKTVAS